MSDATDRVAALALLNEYVQAAAAPVITTTASTGEMDLILDRNKRASTWAAGTAYFAGDIVLPTVRINRRYRCVVSGVSANVNQSSVQYVNITAGGSGYTSAPAVAFTSGGGSGAAGTAILSGGVVVFILITNRGSGYTSAPTVGFSGGGGTAAAGTAVITGPEPFWPRHRYNQGARIADGSSGVDGYTLTWIEDGPQYDNVYDVRQAAHECWLLKAAKASQFVKAGDISFEQVYDHCMTEAARFASLGMG